MKLIADRPKERLIVEGADAIPPFPITNTVRTLRDGTRKSSEVVRSIPENRPYDPRPFPKGLWKITGLDWQKEKGFDPRTYGPVKIRTDAWQIVTVWELDGDGDYLRDTGEPESDSGYLLHYSVFNTTLGCIRLASPSDAEALSRLIQAAWNRGEQVKLEVI